ncbi:phage tail protein [Tenggerimyces flavus]|uniref:Phage tail protein n=1 Tax=Tenggerimyces flavus TaxID=1708749 RepID=A0ABV7YIK1_9ACTN|nr:phage tail protein [Tenggerimyces flavus]MBM7789978.1 phage tail-like protein [Tenggerimyces flavus]
MRGLVSDLVNPQPLLGILPSLYHEDDVTVRFMSAFDDSLAPVFSTLDNFSTYLDPSLAPDDFVRLLAHWVASFDDVRLPESRRRLLVSRAVELHALRGTRAGLEETILVACGVSATVSESGGTSWSSEAGGSPPGSARAEIVVRVAGTADVGLVTRVVEALRPAHVPARVEVVEEGGGS